MNEGRVQGEGEGRDHARARRFGILLMLFFLAFCHSDIMESQNTLSRFVAVEGLVQRGTFHIDQSPHGPRWVGLEDGRTVHILNALDELKRYMAGERIALRAVYDIGKPAEGSNLVRITDGRLVHVLNDMVCNKRDEHFYSSKPPVLTLILAGVLLPLKWLGAEFDFTRRGAEGPAFLLTWLVVGGLSAIAFCAFRRKLGERVQGAQADALTVLTLGGTLFLTYSVTMNHHTFTAGLVLLSFFLLGMADAGGGAPAGGADAAERPRVSDGCALAAGFLMGLASVVDIGPGVAFAMGFGLYILLYLRSWRTLVLFGLGSIPPLALHCIVHYSIWGSVLPVQMMKRAGTRDYAGSYWQNMLPPDTWQIPRSYYWLLTLASGRGLFVLSPILLVGMAALVEDVRRSLRAGRTGEAWRGIFKARGPAAAPGYVALSVLFGVTFLILYTSFAAPTNFNGSCFGMRYYIGFMPLLAFYAARGYVRWCGSAKFRRVFYVLGIVSVFFALVGMQEPWMLMENNANPAVRVLMALLRGFNA
ncbi:MAG: hypothetical protein QGH74_06330 [Candidatus Brocadiia bacterium]|nr:hypothetical protein [Candidatus Brocadiia bacterium]